MSTDHEPNPEPIRNHERRKANVDATLLKKHGWRLVTRQKSELGWYYYWDHPDHQREDGRWWTQTKAAAYQRELNKQARLAKGQE